MKFNLSKAREELSVYLREQGISQNICEDILKVVIKQDKEFIRLLKEEVGNEEPDYTHWAWFIKSLNKLVGKKFR